MKRLVPVFEHGLAEWRINRLERDGFNTATTFPICHLRADMTATHDIDTMQTNVLK